MQHTTIKRSRRRAVLIAACILLLATTAYAAAVRFGVASFFERRGKQLPDNAAGMVETAVPQQTPGNALVTFSVREAVYSGEQFYAVLEARPTKADDYLLLCMDTMPDDPAGNMGIPDTNATLEELAAQQGKALLRVGADIYLGERYVMETADYLTEADGTVVMMLSGTGAGNAGKQQFTCKTSVIPYDAQGGMLLDDEQKNSFPFTLEAASLSDPIIYRQKHPAVVEGAGVTVERVEWKETALEIYAELYFKIDPSATAEQRALASDQLWFEYLDANGSRLADGLTGIGSIEQTEDGGFVQKTSLAAMDTLPASITVRAYDFAEETRFGSITLER
ncbi:MAG TPA: hypothetical protein VN366_00780 [Feifaniaceae bacterium]|nr:hypothetical protein [Feifaniaceae bacterium]